MTLPMPAFLTAVSWPSLLTNSHITVTHYLDKETSSIVLLEFLTSLSSKRFAYLWSDRSSAPKNLQLSLLVLLLLIFMKSFAVYMSEVRIRRSAASKSSCCFFLSNCYNSKIEGALLLRKPISSLSQGCWLTWS